MNLSKEDILSGTADCTQFSGDYSVGQAKSLDIELHTVHAISCGSESLSGKFMGGLEEATSYTVGEDDLVITFGTSGNSMRFIPVE